MVSGRALAAEVSVATKLDRVIRERISGDAAKVGNASRARFLVRVALHGGSDSLPNGLAAQLRPREQRTTMACRPRNAHEPAGGEPSLSL